MSLGIRIQTQTMLEMLDPDPLIINNVQVRIRNPEGQKVPGPAEHQGPQACLEPPAFFS
jgi:hypothetical protein